MCLISHTKVINVYLNVNAKNKQNTDDHLNKMHYAKAREEQWTVSNINIVYLNHGFFIY